MMKKIILCLALVLAVAAYFFMPKQEQGDQNKELKICSSMPKDITELLAKDFAKKSGVKVNVSYLPGGNYQSRKNFLMNNAFDCWLGGSSEEYFMAEEQGLLRRYQAKESHKVPAELRNRRGDWTALYLSYIAIISNKDNLHEAGVYAPTTWAELLEPAFKGKLVFPNPEIGGVAYGMLTGIWQLHGKATALEYAAKLQAKELVIVNSFEEAIDLVYDGKKTSTVVPLDRAFQLEAKHSHLYATVPKDANRNMLTGVAIMNKSTAPLNAEKFVDYLMSDESIKLLKNNDFYYMWHVKNYENTRERVRLAGRVQVPVDDLGWASTYKSEVIRQWREAKLEDAKQEDVTQKTN